MSMGAATILDPDDKLLLEGCLNKSRKSQEQLYAKYAKKMFAICLSYAADRDEAKDVLQEAFVKVFTNLEHYNGQGALQGWIRRIVTNTAIDYYRRGKKIAYFSELPEEPVQEQESFDFSFFDTNVMLNCIKQLPEGARIIFNLFVVEGLSHKEIALKLDISEGTSKSQYSRARSLLKQWILTYKESRS